MDGCRNRGTHGMIAWEGTVHTIDCYWAWGSEIKVPRAAVITWIFKKPMQLGSREKVVAGGKHLWPTSGRHRKWQGLNNHFGRG